MPFLTKLIIFIFTPDNILCQSSTILLWCFYWK